MKLKLPKFTIPRPAFLTRKSAKAKPVKLHAATARMHAEDEFDEPQTRLSSAFFVVLILHVVAVGGIYAFNSIKAHRRGLEPSASTAAPKPAAEKPAAATAAPAIARAPAPAAAAAPEAPVKPVAVPAQITTTPIGNARVYHVKQGDTLTKISQQTGVSVAALQFANKETNTLKPGQILNIPAKTAAAAPSAIEPPAPNPIAKKTESAPAKPASASASSYEVKKNDTATSIAKRFNVSVDDLLKANKITDPTKLQLGAKLTIPAKKN